MMGINFFHFMGDFPMNVRAGIGSLSRTERVNVVKGLNRPDEREATIKGHSLLSMRETEKEKTKREQKIGAGIVECPFKTQC